MVMHQRKEINDQEKENDKLSSDSEIEIESRLC